MVNEGRRGFIKTMITAALLPISTHNSMALNEPVKELHFSSNSYPWLTFYNRDAKEWMADPDACMREFATAGLAGYEPGIASVSEIQALAPLLKKHNIEMRSLYVGSTLHEAGSSQESLDLVMKIAMAAKAVGTKIIVTNPSPIRWDSPIDKDDAALILQAENLNKLGELLKNQGMVLAYHNHDVELRQGAREFHHMLSSTDPRFVSLCLDVHWIYRGSGYSQVALFDVARMYGNRIAELHIRQSKDHIWSEIFGKGDLDYDKLVAELLKMKVRPHLVLEQCVEEKSPHTTDGVTAHRQGLKYAKEVFAPLS